MYAGISVLHIDDLRRKSFSIPTSFSLIPYEKMGYIIISELVTLVTDSYVIRRTRRNPKVLFDWVQEKSKKNSPQTNYPKSPAEQINQKLSLYI